MHRILNILFVLFVSVASIGAQENPAEKSTVLTTSGKVEVGKKLPAFVGIDLFVPGAELYGLEEALKATEGKATGRVIVNFFATWCMPCRVGLDILRDNAEYFAKEGISVVLINIGEERELVRKYIAARAYDFHTVWDRNGSIARKYGVIQQEGDFEGAKVPLTVVADAKGKVILVITTEGSDYLELLRREK